MSSCVQHGRRFTARLLGLLRSMTDWKWTALPVEAKLDIKWFFQYADTANGWSLISPESDYLFIECDASKLMQAL